jgi:hypothetical protein
MPRDESGGTYQYEVLDDKVLHEKGAGELGKYIKQTMISEIRSDRDACHACVCSDVRKVVRMSA